MLLWVYMSGLQGTPWDLSRKAGSKCSDLCSWIEGGDELCDNIADSNEENSNDDDDSDDSDNDVDDYDFKEEGDD